MSMIYGERIRLRAVEREDVKKYFEWVNDPEVTFGLSLYLPMSMTDEEKWFERMSTRAPDEKPFAIEVRAGDGWRLIGNCTFFDIDTVVHSAEIGHHDRRQVSLESGTGHRNDGIAPASRLRNAEPESHFFEGVCR